MSLYELYFILEKPIFILDIQEKHPSIFHHSDFLRAKTPPNQHFYAIM